MPITNRLHSLILVQYTGHVGEGRELALIQKQLRRLNLRCLLVLKILSKSQSVETDTLPVALFLHKKLTC